MQYVYDGDDLVAAYYPDGYGNATDVMVLVYGPGVDDMVFERNLYDGDRYYYKDAMGSVVGLATDGGCMLEVSRYDAYGAMESLGWSGWSPWSPGTGYQFDPTYGFTGRELDQETGLYYYRARYYNPAIGRFLQTDPIGYYDSLNLYQYCGNNPVNFVDPYGLWSVWGLLVGEPSWEPSPEQRRQLRGAAKEGAQYGLEEWQNAGSLGYYDRHGMTHAAQKRQQYGGVGTATKWVARGGVASLYSAIAIKATGLDIPIGGDVGGGSQKKCPKPPTEYEYHGPESKPHFNKDTQEYDVDGSGHYHYWEWDWNGEEWKKGSETYGGPGYPPDMTDE